MFVWPAGGFRVSKVGVFMAGMVIFVILAGLQANAAGVHQGASLVVLLFAAIAAGCGYGLGASRQWRKDHGADAE